MVMSLSLPRILAGLLLALSAPLATSASALTSIAIANITLDGSTALHRYDGHGGLSAGASSRLLIDYPEPQRSQILDYLFKPNFGAGFHTLKIEIGGDGQSTDGSCPSHMHTRNDYSCERGVELWLLEEAKLRNPDIVVFGLVWAAPGWINNGTFYGPDMIDYILKWADCVVQRGGDVPDYVGLWNEAAQPQPDYLVELRQSLDAGGYEKTGIVVMDNGYFNTQEVEWAQQNDTYRQSIAAAGLHDPCEFFYGPLPAARDLGWSLWASEDFSRDVSQWQDSQNYWGKALSQHYVEMNITATISWSAIWSVYKSLICNGAGLMVAQSPWSGSYTVSPTIWLHAHYGQFVQPGWKYLHVPGGGSGYLNVAGMPLHAGTYVTLVPPQGQSGMTVVVETLADRSCLRRNLSNYDITLTTGGGLPGPGTVLHVWLSTQTALFVQQPSITIGPDSTFRITIEPDAMITVSTVSTAVHGSFPDSPIPAAAPWALPYNDSFDASAYPYDSMAHFFADQAGSWAVRNGTLQQVSGGQPIAWAPNGDPLSIVGDDDWIDYAVSATAVFSGPPSAWKPQTATTGGWGNPRPRGRPAPSSSHALESNSANIFVDTCDPTSGAQIFAFNSSLGWFSSTWGSGGLGCMTSCGCSANCIQMFSCGSEGCGTSGQSYNWSLNAATGALTNFAFPGQMLTADASMGSVALMNATGAGNQVWAFDSQTGLVSCPSLGLCLTQQKPSKTYAAVCARMTGYDGFNAVTTPAYCLAVFVNGQWALLVNSAPALTGNLSGFVSTVPHRLSVSVAGPIVDVYLNGTLLGELTDTTYAQGNAAVGSGWHAAAFDDFEVTVPFEHTLQRKREWERSRREARKGRK